MYLLFVAKELGLTPEFLEPERGDPTIIQKLLWPVASFFHTVAGVAEYRQSSEREADAVLEALEADPTAWADFSSNAGRVLYERAKYALAILELNTRAGEKVICPPSELGEDMQRVAATLLWLHKMQLPSEWPLY